MATSTVKYLAHAPGMSEWLPLGEVLDYVIRAGEPRLPTLPAGATTTRVAARARGPSRLSRSRPFCRRCRALLSRYPEPTPAAAPPHLPPIVEKVEIKPAPPAVPQPLPKPASKPETQLPPAPFIPRFIAFLIDFAILFVPVGLLYAIGALAIAIPSLWNHIDHESLSQEWSQLNHNMRQLAWLVAVGFGWIYGAGLESSRRQATIGKRWMGIKVTDAQGERLSFPHATGRYAAKYLSALPCFLGFIMALFSSRNLTLHDRLAGTRAVRA